MLIQYIKSKSEGSNLSGERVKQIEIRKNNTTLSYYLRFKTEFGAYRTAPLLTVIQSAEDTLLFYTESGSRYAFIFEEADFKAGETISSLKDVINSCWGSHLKFCDLGKRILSVE